MSTNVQTTFSKLMKMKIILRNFAFLALFFLPLIASQARNETDDFDPMNLNNETEFETMDNSTSTNKTTGVLDNLLAFLFTPLIGSGTKNQTSENTTMINDEFDDFFNSIDDPEPPTLDFKLNKKSFV